MRSRLRSRIGALSATASDISLQSVVASAVFDLDATVADSYPGTGTTWANLAAIPADGSAQTAYDFHTGDGADNTTYPVFNGSAGDPGAYWSFDGVNDFFRLKSGTNTNFLGGLHKTAGGDDFWLAFAIRAADATWPSFEAVFATLNSVAAGGSGILVQATSSETIRLLQAYGGAAIAASSVIATPGGDHIVIVSHSHAENKTRFWIDMTTAEEVAHTFQTNTNAANGAATIAAYTNNTANLDSEFRIYSVAMGNEYLDDAKAAAIIAHLEARHGRDYTP